MASPAAIGAVAIFDNMAAGSPNGAFGVGNQQWSAQAFTTTQSNYTISEVSLRLWNQNGTSGAFQVGIFDASGASGSPGSTPATIIYTGLAEELGSSDGSVLQISGLSVSLLPETNYYLAVLGTELTEVLMFDEFSSPGTLYWGATDVNNGPVFSTGDSAANWSGPYPQNLYMSISAEAVPEPGVPGMLALVAMTTLGLRRRFHRL